MSHFRDFFELYCVTLKIKGKRMTKIIMLSLVAAAVLFTGCGEDTEKDATKAVESTKEVAHNAMDATKDAVDKAVEATKEAAQATKEAAIKALDSAEESVTKTVGTAVAGAVESYVVSAGKEAYAKCAGCHGADGKTKALGKSPVIAGQSKEDLVTKLNGYKAGTINVAGMGNLMKGQVASMDDTAIEAVSIYISKMK